MYLRYGAYTHALDEANVVISKEQRLTDANIRIGTTERWAISGQIIGSSISDLTTKILAMEAAYAKFNVNLHLLDNDLNETAHKIIANATNGGIVVERIDFPVGDGSEYVLSRSYAIAIRADYGARSANAPGGNSGGGAGDGGGGQPNTLIRYQESLTFRGNGGPRRVVREIRNGYPVEQIVSQRTPVYATQRGSATGYFAPPRPPRTIWPAFVMNADSEVSSVSPTRVGVGVSLEQVVYETTWNYQFVSPGPLTGTPTTN